MPILNLFNRKFALILAFIFLAELFSLFGYLLSDFNKIGFFIIVLLILIASLIKLEYGLWILFTELFIGSKGYLFFFEDDGIIISIRIALWLVVMAVWLGQTISYWIKNKKLQIRFFKSSYSSYFLILFLFIIWGIVNGFLNNNETSNIFFDFNGWLYFTLIFPVYSVFKKNDREMGMTSAVQLTPPINTILQIFTASIIWLSAKTFFLLFVFFHNIISITSELYRWVRVSGVGEITQMQGGFYRIFFQSHIFVLIGFFVFLLLLTSKILGNRQSPPALAEETLAKRNKPVNRQSSPRETLMRRITLFSVFCFLFSTILISFSRSFWAGLIVGLLFYYFIILLFYKIGWKKFIIANAILLCAGIFSVGLIVAVVKFPYPQPLGGFATTELLSKRAGQITGEAGVSSRWALLPELWNKIKQAPILGQGFGAAVTYQSSDPRVLQSSPTGKYTTYAFEWGWLDIWLKLGVFGMLAYLILIGKIFVIGAKKLLINNDNQLLIVSLIIGLIVISVVSIFSPYMNHPLGIGYLILISAILESKKQITDNFQPTPLRNF
ncbi:MAG: O-antigen ligase family protein [Patescibacteria group bacterium]|nr:O-antigen ligase family protein [Patescibacteria group bacterium]